jgi:cytochrome-b5 reductase
MLPIIHSALTNPDKKVKISLLFAAQSPEDLYFKDELDQLSRTFSNQFKVSYTVDRVPESSAAAKEWKGHVGYINDKMLNGLIPAPNATSNGGNDGSEGRKASVVLICGPESMVRHVAGSRGASGQEPIRGVLGALGYQRNQVFRFPN